ncbi:hypothetical protein [Pareuzebyella sediminis]|uniref:hypothetical protein n=1 Tax=Pareuzebyella sediminis TaxID=2607998 RepID=UPI0011F007FB|nr:hypothetical protein [Pareuzebyella sediminis]
MKKHILLILIILTFSAKSIAQDCEYTEYYPLVELARKNYSGKKYKEAEKNFKLAFKKTNHPFGADLHLAFAVAQKLKNSEWAEQIAIRLAKGGVPLRYFRYHKKYEWYDKFSADFNTYSDYYKENYNQKLRDKFLSLLNRDNEFNSKYHDWRTREIELSLDELINGASEIISDFKQMTDEYGFPNERLMGYNYIPRKNSIERYHSGALIIHIYQRGVLVFENEIHEIVCDGGLHPNYQETLKKIRGFGNSTGVEQEMKARYAKYRGTE